MPDLTPDICIIGAGAAGLTAAIFAAQTAPAAHILLLDSARKIGAKILVAGGGRCNVTHHTVTPDDYNAPSKNIVRNILRSFDEHQTVNWFRSLGVELKREDTGKLFPTTDHARTVLDALLTRTRALNIHLLESQKVSHISHTPTADHPFTLTHGPDHSTTRAKRLILATGGRSLPKTGSDGSGYPLAQRLGHSITPTYPALVPLVLDDSFFHKHLSGTSITAELSTYTDNKLTDRRTGPLLFTHFGLSGPLAMDASRHYTTARGANRAVRLHLSLLPNRPFEHVELDLLRQTDQRPKARISTLLAEWLPEKIARTLLAFIQIPAETTLAHLPKDPRRALTHALTALPLPVTNDRGWNHAEVTAGGVPLEQINYRRMESRITPHLHLAGEILDCDGRIGGFNFQWAWSTGYLAGTAAARSLPPTPQT